jgi:SNF2 family DNA or RNA helicase
MTTPTFIGSLDTVVQPGDRIDIASAPILVGNMLRVPLDTALNNFLAMHNADIRLESRFNTEILHDADAQSLLAEIPQNDAAFSEILANAAQGLALQCVQSSPLVFSLVAPTRISDTNNASKALQTLALQNVQTESGVGISFNAHDTTLLGLPKQHIVSLERFRANQLATQLGMVAGFEDLLGLALVRDMQPLEHQISTVKTALRRFRGRAMFCDEVGLGKTVEAGMTTLELIVRGLARRVLVLTPPSLVAQWHGEMKQKFGLEFLAYDTVMFKEQGLEPLSTHDRIILSYHTAKRDPYRSEILRQEWDVVVIDEVHHFRNRTTLLWKFAAELKKKYIFLLTATPVQNNLEELFNLVTLLQPGLLSTANTFQKQFVDKTDKLKPRNVEQLHSLLAEVMIRNSRSNVGIAMTRRIARTESVPLSKAERTLYDEVSRFIVSELRTKSALKEAQAAEKEAAKAARESAKAAKLSGKHTTKAKTAALEELPEPKKKATAKTKAPAESITPESSVEEPSKGLSKIGLLTLQRELGSSPQAAAGTLRRMADDTKLAAAVRKRLAAMAEAAHNLRDNAKTERLLKLVKEFPDKIVIFTQFRETQTMLYERLQAAGEDVVMFHGGMLRLQKEGAIAQFRASARILLTTDAGSEGRNLQFCNAICNFDLPWNPMKIEQRIGRLSRIGQQRDVYVFNFAAADTFESAVLHLLEAKIAMFELVVGEIDMILGNVDEEQEFEEMVTDLWVEPDSMQDFTGKLDHLGNKLLAAKETYLKQKELEDRLFGDKFGVE